MAGRRGAWLSGVMCGMCAALCGCGGARGIEVRVLRGGAGGVGGEPVEGAHVRALPLDTSVVPLPVSLENLKAALLALGDSGITDARGVVGLEVDAARTTLIEVNAPAFSGEVDAGPWEWVVGPGSFDAVRAGGARGDGPYVIEVGPGS